MFFFSWRRFYHARRLIGRPDRHRPVTVCNPELVSVTRRCRRGGEGGVTAGFLRASFILRSLSSHDKGQAGTMAEGRSGSVTSSGLVSPTHSEVPRWLWAGRTSECREQGSSDTKHTGKMLVQGERGWLHSIVLYKRMMSSVLMSPGPWQ